MGHGKPDAFGARAVADEVGIGIGDVDEEEFGAEAAGPQAGFAEHVGRRAVEIQCGEHFHGASPRFL